MSKSVSSGPFENVANKYGCCAECSTIGSFLLLQYSAISAKLGNGVTKQTLLFLLFNDD